MLIIDLLGLLFHPANVLSPILAPLLKSCSALCVNLHNYFNYHVCPSIRPGVPMSVTKFFSLKSPWNHPLTPGVDPQG